MRHGRKARGRAGSRATAEAATFMIPLHRAYATTSATTAFKTSRTSPGLQPHLQAALTAVNIDLIMRQRALLDHRAHGACAARTG